jgi:hypothetical protein
MVARLPFHLYPRAAADIGVNAMRPLTFRDLAPGNRFDWINPEAPNYASFFLRCTKVSTYRYQDQSGIMHRVGSINAKVFHVEKE